MHLLFNVNFATLVTYFTSSTSRFWIHSDEAEIYFKSRSIQLSLFTFHVTMVSDCLYYQQELYDNPGPALIQYSNIYRMCQSISPS